MQYTRKLKRLGALVCHVPNELHPVRRTIMKLDLFGSFRGTGLIITITGACLLLVATARAVTPAPDGGYPGENTAEGDFALNSLTSGVDNTGIGFKALFSNTTGSYNKADGAFALAHNTSGRFNTGEGFRALFMNTTGTRNTAVGAGALQENTTGNRNIGIGFHGGVALTTGSDNIDIGNPGDSTDFKTIRIGVEGIQLATFIAGIDDVVLTGDPVCVSASGQLGECNPSSERFKHDIAPMDKASEVILAFKPVTFRYNADLDPKEAAQFGLVAEDVEKVAPGLVRHDKDGKINGVRYEAVNVMLLNEFLKEHRRIEEQASRIAEQEKTIQTLTAGLKDQAAQIQKVSAELTLIKSRPQLVENAK
jgi:uncharacterized coiled-coil protein SlyX